MYAGIESVAFDSFAGGEEERYFAPINDAQGGGPAGDQSSRDGGVVPKAQGTWKQSCPESALLAGSPASS
jgi:hypothetical protein